MSIFPERKVAHCYLCLFLDSPCIASFIPLELSAKQGLQGYLEELGKGDQLVDVDAHSPVLKITDR